MSPPKIIIPYERQSDPRKSRTCGAACLSMIYRSFGLEVSQAHIWPAIAKTNQFGSVASTTYLMAHDAVSRGFAAVVIQARHPLQVLRLCRDSGIRAILNHRSMPDRQTGHYTVLVDIDDTSVFVHDPFYGPARRLSHAELLALWQPRSPKSEIVGNVLIGVAASTSADAACAICRNPIPSAVDCPKCARPIGLQPSELLGCMSSTCAARMWNYLCCPSCEFTWTFNIQTAAAAPADASRPSPAAAAVSEQDPWGLERLFGELDKFCSHVRSVPVAANHPDIRRQLDFIAASRERLKLAQAEELVHRETREAQLAALTDAAKQREQEHRRKMKELNTTAAPLDADALAAALLKNLGLKG
jgi:hypothetical protein